MIGGLYKRAKNLAARIVGVLGVPSNAAEMASFQKRLEKMWGDLKPEHHTIMNDMLALLEDLNGQAPATYPNGTLSRSLVFVRLPGTPGHNNGPEGVIRWFVVRPRHIFDSLHNWQAASNFETIQTFAATCRKNGTSPYHAVLAMASDPEWSMFTAHVPQPIFRA